MKLENVVIIYKLFGISVRKDNNKYQVEAVN